MQRESMSRGSIGKPPGTSGGRAPLHFGHDDPQPKRYLPKLRGAKVESDRGEYFNIRKDDDQIFRNTEKRSQPNQAFSRGSKREQKRKQFAIFPEGFNPHEELEG